MAGREVRGAPGTPARRRLPHARLAQRSRRRGAGSMAQAEPLGHERRREPRRRG